MLLLLIYEGINYQH